MIKQTPVKGSKKVKVNFVLPKESTAGKVSVVGDFNGWDPFVHPLKPRSNGTRSVSVTLPVSQRFAFRYLDEHGHNTTLWPDFTFRFRQLTKTLDRENYVGTPEVAP